MYSSDSFFQHDRFYTTMRWREQLGWLLKQWILHISFSKWWFNFCFWVWIWIWRWWFQSILIQITHSSSRSGSDEDQEDQCDLLAADILEEYFTGVFWLHTSFLTWMVILLKTPLKLWTVLFHQWLSVDLQLGQTIQIRHWLASPECSWCYEEFSGV